MKNHIWDNDNAVMVCSTDSRKEAFTAILKHLIEANGSEVPDPIMWPITSIYKPNEQMPETAPVYDDAWSLIRQAQEAYNRITGFIPMA